MTVLPGSLDYLYNYGILEHVPYEAYGATPMTASGMAQISGMGSGLRQNPMTQGYGDFQNSQIYSPQYMQQAGFGYNNGMNNQPDMFVQKEQPFMKNSFSKTAEKAINLPTWIKGVLAGGIMLLTACCMFKSGKKIVKTPQNIKPNLWEKLKGMFKKK